MILLMMLRQSNSQQLSPNPYGNLLIIYMYFTYFRDLCVIINLKTHNENAAYIVYRAT